MVRAIKKGLQLTEEYILRSVSRTVKFAQGLGSSGTRAAPNSTKDKSIGVRIDLSHARKTNSGQQKRTFNLQVNKGADDSTLKRLADSNSHRIWAQYEATVDPTLDPRDKDDQERAKSIVKNIIGGLKSNIEEE